MHKIIVLIMICVLTSCGSSRGQYVTKDTSRYIVYNLPQSVIKKADDYFAKYRAVGDSSKFIGNLTNNGNGNYTLFLINYDFAGLENYKSIEELVKRTSRMIRIREVLLPLITEEDFLFADFGEVIMKDGRIGRKRIIFTAESYSITFDTRGEIYD